MSPNTLGFLLQWPIFAASLGLFRAGFGWSWVATGFAALFASMVLTYVVVQTLYFRQSRAQRAPTPRSREA